jgi:hypothetical protein
MEYGTTFAESGYKKWFSYYKEYLKTEHWKTKSQKCYDYYGGECHDCSEYNVKNKTNSHHLNYSCLWKECIGKDIILLCISCHKKIHGKYKKKKEKKIKKVRIEKKRYPIGTAIVLKRLLSIKSNDNFYPHAA